MCLHNQTLSIKLIYMSSIHREIIKNKCSEQLNSNKINFQLLIFNLF